MTHFIENVLIIALVKRKTEPFPFFNLIDKTGKFSWHALFIYFSKYPLLSNEFKDLIKEIERIIIMQEI